MRNNIRVLSALNCLEYGALFIWGVVLPLTQKPHSTIPNDEPPWGLMAAAFSCLILLVAASGFAWCYSKLKSRKEPAVALQSSLLALFLAPIALLLAFAVVFVGRGIIGTALVGIDLLFPVIALWIPFWWVRRQAN